MYRIGMVGAVSLGLGLAGCSASSTTGDALAAKPRGATQWTLHLKSEPSGAEVKAPQGQACRTPCELLLPTADTEVTFALDGYYPQMVPVKWLPATFHYELYEHTEEPAPVSYPTDFSPNPVIAQLEPAPAAAKAAQPKPRRKTSKQAAAVRPPVPSQPVQGSPFPPPPAR